MPASMHPLTSQCSSIHLKSRRGCSHMRRHSGHFALLCLLWCLRRLQVSAQQAQRSAWPQHSRQQVPVGLHGGAGQGQGVSWSSHLFTQPGSRSKQLSKAFSFSHSAFSPSLFSLSCKITCQGHWNLTERHSLASDCVINMHYCVLYTSQRG